MDERFVRLEKFASSEALCRFLEVDVIAIIGRFGGGLSLLGRSKRLTFVYVVATYRRVPTFAVDLLDAENEAAAFVWIAVIRSRPFRACPRSPRRWG